MASAPLWDVERLQLSTDYNMHGDLVLRGIETAFPNLTCLVVDCGGCGGSSNYKLEPLMKLASTLVHLELRADEVSNGERVLDNLSTLRGLRHLSLDGAFRTCCVHLSTLRLLERLTCLVSLKFAVNELGDDHHTYTPALDLSATSRLQSLEIGYCWTVFCSAAEAGKRSTASIWSHPPLLALTLPASLAYFECGRVNDMHFLDPDGLYDASALQAARNDAEAAIARTGVDMGRRGGITTGLKEWLLGRGVSLRVPARCVVTEDTRKEETDWEKDWDGEEEEVEEEEVEEEVKEAGGGDKDAGDWKGQESTIELGSATATASPYTASPHTARAEERSQPADTCTCPVCLRRFGSSAACAAHRRDKRDAAHVASRPAF